MICQWDRVVVKSVAERQFGERKFWELRFFGADGEFLLIDEQGGKAEAAKLSPTLIGSMRADLTGAVWGKYQEVQRLLVNKLEFKPA